MSCWAHLLPRGTLPASARHPLFSLASGSLLNLSKDKILRSVEGGQVHHTIAEMLELGFEG